MARPGTRCWGCCCWFLLGISGCTACATGPDGGAGCCSAQLQCLFGWGGSLEPAAWPSVVPLAHTAWLAAFLRSRWLAGTSMRSTGSSTRSSTLDRLRWAASCLAHRLPPAAQSRPRQVPQHVKVSAGVPLLSPAALGTIFPRCPAWGYRPGKNGPSARGARLGYMRGPCRACCTGAPRGDLRVIIYIVKIRCGRAHRIFIGM